MDAFHRCTLCPFQFVSPVTKFKRSNLKKHSGVTNRNKTHETPRFHFRKFRRHFPSLWMIIRMKLVRRPNEMRKNILEIAKRRRKQRKKNKKKSFSSSSSMRLQKSYFFFDRASLITNLLKMIMEHKANKKKSAESQIFLPQIAKRITLFPSICLGHFFLELFLNQLKILLTEL